MNCIVCGKEFVADSHLRLTCSKECALENKRRTTRESYHRKKNGEKGFPPRRYNPDYKAIPQKEQKKIYRQNNKDKIKIRSKKYYEENPDTIKNGNLKQSFGITLVDYKLMIEKQSGVCGICYNPETSKHSSGKTKTLAVDHCHTTGRIRGLLCWKCNVGIGKFKDSVELLQNAINYLNKSREND